jgi:RNA polymerase subunit RPABC4/transcription elongation factor Spt4
MNKLKVIRANKKALGLCVYCTKPAQTGKTLCIEHLLKLKEQRRVESMERQNCKHLLNSAWKFCPLCGKKIIVSKNMTNTESSKIKNHIPESSKMVTEIQSNIVELEDNILLEMD